MEPGNHCFSTALRTSLVCLLFLPTGHAVGQTTVDREGSDYFETHIRPVLIEHCYQCHSSDAKIVQGELRLDTAEGMKMGGDSGPLFQGTNADLSLLLSALNWEDYEMPPAGKLPAETIQHFRLWIDMGAPDPRSENLALSADLNRDKQSRPQEHWAFWPPNKITPPELPVAPPGDWPIRDLDRFVLRTLQQQGIEPSTRAGPRTLLRRLHFVLTGLPPTPEEYAAFESAADDEHSLKQLYEEAVDRLLDSPEFGQRWGRHWLDVARYADTKGYVFQEDRNYPHAYRYRDWVIDSFNSDLPYDQFVLAQLAADHLDDPVYKPAMGFLTLGRRFINNQHDIIDDRIDVMSRGLMGLTVACARCHDHKYDPVSIKEYYSLYGIFASGHELPQPKPEPPVESATDNDKVQADLVAANGAESEATEVPRETKAGSDESMPAMPPPPEPDDYLMLRDAPPYHQPVVFLRGNPDRHGEAVPRQFLQILSPEPVRPYADSSGRLEMARAIVSPQNPLTGRVWVNRVWGHVIGNGLVRTPSDFGTRGEPPTHPELLDWLTCRFIEEGWSTKWLIREIVLSRTFCQSSDFSSVPHELDPENRGLWRMNRRRLDWETMRDNLLLAAGELDRSLGGPAFDLTQEPISRRRTVYGFVERQNLPAVFRTFDFANPDTHTPQRPHTVVPQQALFLMNSPFARDQAIRLAGRAEITDAPTDADKVHALYQIVYGRAATEFELERTTRFLEEQFAVWKLELNQRKQLAEKLVEGSTDVSQDSAAESRGPDLEPLTPWQQLAQVLLMTNELIFID
jgi:hypothetical protein